MRKFSELGENLKMWKLEELRILWEQFLWSQIIFKNIVPLAREYDAGDLIGIYDNDSMVGFWATNNVATGEITRVALYLSQLYQFTNSDDPLINIGFLVTKIIKYIRYLHETREKVLKVDDIQYWHKEFDILLLVTL